MISFIWRKEAALARGVCKSFCLLMIFSMISAMTSCLWLLLERIFVLRSLKLLSLLPFIWPLFRVVSRKDLGLAYRFLDLRIIFVRSDNSFAYDLIVFLCSTMLLSVWRGEFYMLPEVWSCPIGTFALPRLTIDWLLKRDDGLELGN